jgi:hypothetical protein
MSLRKSDTAYNNSCVDYDSDIDFLQLLTYKLLGQKA